MSLQTQFTAFLQDIEPSATTKQRSMQAHTSLRDYLKNHKVFKAYHVDTFLSGSYRRDTAIRPRTKNGDEERPDVDIIVVTNHTLSDSPAAVADLLYNALQDGYEDIRRQARSVGVFTATADMDAVPIIMQEQWDGTVKFYIPDRKLERLVETNPPGHTAWTVDVNRDSDGRFKPLVKLTKWWRRVGRDNRTLYKRPKGFVIECITAACMDYEETQWGELFVGMLEAVVARYRWDIAVRRVPYIPDPGVPTNSVTSGMEFKEFEAFYKRAQLHASVGRKALQLQEEDPEKALELWRQIFGPRFPAPKAKRKTAGLLEEAIIPSSLTFPDRPIVPRKPGGFA